jgi:predicted transcriptional regulator
MERKLLEISIISNERYKERTIAIANGKYKPGKWEPKIWFESLQSLAQVLISENRELLRIIEEQNPALLKEVYTAAKKMPSLRTELIT